MELLALCSGLGIGAVLGGMFVLFFVDTCTPYVKGINDEKERWKKKLLSAGLAKYLLNEKTGVIEFHELWRAEG